MMCIAAYKNILNANYFEKGTVDIGRKNFDVIQDFVKNRIVSFIAKKKGFSSISDINKVKLDIATQIPVTDLVFSNTVLGKGAFGELPLNDIDRINITYQMLLGITFLHEFRKKVLHRDIEPANIMITKKKIVKICDLGVSTINQLDTQLLTTHGRKSFVGTPMYMAPEVYLRQQEVTEYGDIWSLACTLVEMFIVLKREIEKCFNYNPVMWPKAKEILMVLKNSGIEVEIY
ncbi:serine/threonine-protein kinase 24-like [Trichogramma pretiosum]|uniref:serine/threonine-protein kinase 24-like n=1 Tax=Trichogramma pretiosum TaxID=7493 RepID=UPI000C718A2E|nr:serine/threonine-protein kinase 24-like [Trichogramma pretiosum]